MAIKVEISQEDDGIPSVIFESGDEMTLFQRIIQEKNYEIGLDFKEQGIQAEDLIKELSNLSEDMYEKVIALNLSSNDLKYLPEEIGKFKNLVFLYCADNPLTELPTCIGNFDLCVLSFPETEIKVVPEEEILKMKNLKIVSAGKETIFSDDFIKNVREDITFYFDGDNTTAEKDFKEKVKRLKQK